MILYTLNTPCWTDYDANNTSGVNLIDSKLSDHFTFMYYNLMKYGLVDEVAIFLDEKRIKRGIKNRTFDTDYGMMSIWDGREISNLDLKEEQIVYCWSNWIDCKKLKNNLVIVNPMFSNVMYPSCFDPTIHDYALIEGESFQKTVPGWMPSDVFRYTSKDFCDITDNERDQSLRTYDWIMVSSFDPRKRHIQFMESIVKNAAAKGLRGCIVGRNPDNKGRINEGHNVLSKVQSIIKDNNLSVDIFLNASQEKKKNLMLQSKLYVCPSSLDNGPRSMIEAAQSGCVLISMPHIGSSGVISPGVTGEIFSDLKNSADVVVAALNSYNQYDINLCGKELAPSNVYPKLVEKIRNLHNDKFK